MSRAVLFVLVLSFVSTSAKEDSNSQLLTKVLLELSLMRKEHLQMKKQIHALQTQLRDPVCSCNTFNSSISVNGDVKTPLGGKFNNIDVANLAASTIKNTGKQTIAGELYVQQLSLAQWSLREDPNGDLKFQGPPSAALNVSQLAASQLSTAQLSANDILVFEPGEAASAWSIHAGTDKPVRALNIVGPKNNPGVWFAGTNLFGVDHVDATEIDGLAGKPCNCVTQNSDHTFCSDSNQVSIGFKWHCNGGDLTNQCKGQQGVPVITSDTNEGIMCCDICVSKSSNSDKERKQSSWSLDRNRSYCRGKGCLKQTEQVLQN